jgi:hypothetical protein
MIAANMTARDRGCANRFNKPGLAISKRPWRRKLTERADAKTPQFVKLMEWRYLEVKARFPVDFAPQQFIDKICAVHILAASETGAAAVRIGRRKIRPRLRGLRDGRKFR